MLEKKPTPAGAVHVTFSLAPDGHELPVCLAGDFNGWADGALPLRVDGDGRLVVVVALPPGTRNEFRYRDAQGRWFNDPEADDYCDNEWGGMNGVVLT